LKGGEGNLSLGKKSKRISTPQGASIASTALGLNEGLRRWRGETRLFLLKVLTEKGEEARCPSGRRGWETVTKKQKKPGK